MLKVIMLKVFLAVAALCCANIGWGLCKLSNEESDKRDQQDKGKKGILAMGMLLCWILGGIALYKLIIM